MSGGVDSSLAAALLVEEGFDVVGVTLLVGGAGDEVSAAGRGAGLSRGTVDRARDVARALGIRHLVVDAGAAFRRDVLEPFRAGYLNGRTPNPCVECNARVKFPVLLEHARALGCDVLATGHYARTDRDPDRGCIRLLRGADRSKDQSYFLWGLSQDHLRFARFPVGHLTKEEVRARAQARGFRAEGWRESQDVCFGSGDPYFRWLEAGADVGPRGGWIRDTSGRVLGSHRGVHRYTIGQRRGLGIALGKPRYVVRIDPEDRSVVVGNAADLMSDALVGSDVHVVSGGDVGEGPVWAKIRYRHAPSKARVERVPGGIRVEFEAPQRAVTPGQSVVFYRGDEVLGGAVIRAPGGRPAAARGNRAGAVGGVGGGTQDLTGSSVAPYSPDGERGIRRRDGRVVEGGGLENR